MLTSFLATQTLRTHADREEEREDRRPVGEGGEIARGKDKGTQMSEGKTDYEHGRDQVGMYEHDQELIGIVKGMPDGEANKLFQTLSDPEKEAASGLAGAHVAHIGARPDQGAADNSSLSGELDSEWESDWYGKNSDDYITSGPHGGGLGCGVGGLDNEQGTGNMGPGYTNTYKGQATDVERHPSKLVP